jgi:hypothetical protein
MQNTIGGCMEFQIALKATDRFKMLLVLIK